MSEFDNCEYCTHCTTVNDDMDTYCHLRKSIIHAVCMSFEHFEGKKESETEDIAGSQQ